MQEDEAPNPRAPPLIAAIQGGSNRLIQETMWRFARRCTELGLCVVGLIETFETGGETGRRTGWITNIRSGVSYSLFQDLGMMASACHLDGAGIVAACVDICAEIEAGCDLVILSKFGQLEEMQSGLTDAFALAVTLEIPILTAVAPAYMGSWETFSSPMSVMVPPDDDALDRWRRDLRLGSDVPSLRQNG